MGSRQGAEDTHRAQRASLKPTDTTEDNQRTAARETSENQSLLK